MQTQTNQNDTQPRDHDMDEELAGILTAISVVSKRLAKKLMTLSKQEGMAKGGKPDGQDE
ncbi:MAG: hypothetical protein K0M69_03590 [Youngiibacter sp.]|jgi:hypothetical protein|nr:hypothetical protein [Youngiibacter sp.]